MLIYDEFFLCLSYGHGAPRCCDDNNLIGDLRSVIPTQIAPSFAPPSLDLTVFPSSENGFMLRTGSEKVRMIERGKTLTESRKQNDLTISDPWAPVKVTFSSGTKLHAECFLNCTRSKLSRLCSC
jgi:hypothetical protein